MRPLRSLLFVPAHREGWADKAVRAGADAVILDLEDSVPPSLKDQARIVAAATIDSLRTTNPDVTVLVRPNALDTEYFGKDLAAVVRPGLDGLLLPKVYGAREVLDFAALLTHFEIEACLPKGCTEVIPTLETAKSLVNCEEIAAAHPRVASLMVAAARDADVSREVGFEWTAEGLETLHYRSKAVLACRAAGLAHPIVGLWQEIADLDGLRQFAEGNRRLGFAGQVLIHPSHIETVNDVYAPNPEIVDRFRRMIEAFEKAQANGQAAALFEGEHVDIAHVKTARGVVALAESINNR
ncbi:MAG: CoA ester lyase [Rhodococcus sp. (in: high G+C Gram-positive bacteria)]|uniref:HpcH/HpaI aldolase/citrate lyase family protein n=1 Tax=Rhodococcus sp. TaxID=1831 RepID=UPI00121235C0|nr:CoA ester lyase [Rhodococcus sp. (in: high G+C Gram-positive bacteria)]RZL24644.1 MAG: CoA ester lyase [Rhodococcus sp. (in: high G+C Gram-positive bacteria)]